MTWEYKDLSSPEFAVKPQPPNTAGLLYEGMRHVLSGPPESAKTVCAYAIALELIRSGGEAGEVAIVDFEMGAEATRALLEDLGATLDEIQRRFWYIEADSPPDKDDIEGLIDNGAGLVIVDAAAGAYDVSELDDNKRKDTEAFARCWIKPLWKAGVTTLLNDHVTKNADTRGRYAIGSERKLGGTDVHLGLEAIKPLHRGGEGIVRIKTHKDRRGFLSRPNAAELHLRSDPDTHAISWSFEQASKDSTDDWRPTVLMQRIYEYVEQNATASRNQIEKAVKGKSTDWKRTAMDYLVADGYLEEREGERGARMLHPVRPYNLPTSPDLASTSPGEDLVTSPTSPPLQGRGEDEDEVERLRLRLVEEMGV